MPSPLTSIGSSFKKKRSLGCPIASQNKVMNSLYDLNNERGISTVLSKSSLMSVNVQEALWFTRLPSLTLLNTTVASPLPL